MSMTIDEDREQIQMEVESLTLNECVMLEKLPGWIEKQMSLKELRIEYWPRLVTIPEGTTYQIRCFEELNIDDCTSLISFGKRQLPPTLKKLNISNCINLKSLFREEDEGDTSSSSSINLEHLKILNCESLTSISSTRELTAALKHLEIELCEKIESIAEGFDDNSSLETLTIGTCSTLKALPEGLGNLINLSEFQLVGCPCIVSFPRGGLPSSCLKILVIVRLKKLEALPDNLHRLSSLQELTIGNCPKLVSFPSEGLPSNLTLLEISHVKLTKALFEWGLDRLSSLQKLWVSGGYREMRSFSSDETTIKLPPSLISLRISHFPNLENLSARCFCDLTSLEVLSIKKCPKLASFPKNGLPDSLLQLTLDGCPLLK